MINLLFDQLRLIEQIRNTSDYENKSKEDLIKALSESKPETTKPDTKLKPETPKPDTKPKQTSKPKPKPEPEPKIKLKVNKKRLEKIRKDFDELRHTFSNKEIIEKLFMLLKTKNIFLNQK